MATSPDAVRRALVTVSAAAVAEVSPLLRADRPEDSRAAIFEAAPAITAAYVEGSSALAADWYEELREDARPKSRHLTVVRDWERADKYGRALAWATATMLLEEPDVNEARSRLATVTEYEVFGGFAETTEANVRSDKDARGWKRNARGEACPFCRMLADRGVVYRKEASASFAAHSSCRCTIVPVFVGGDEGPEANVMQYVASKKRRSEADKARLRDYLRQNYGGT